MSVSVTEQQLRLGQAALRPVVKVGGRALPPDAASRLVRVVVDLHLSLPDTFTLTFFDLTGTVLSDAGIRLGGTVAVEAGTPESGTPKPLVNGEVTALEGVYDDRGALTIVRGSTADHRLQRFRRSRTFVDAKDSDVARKVASEAGLKVGRVDATRQVHPLLTQDNQTDWQFLRERAEEVGYDVGVTDGKLYFRKAAPSGKGAAGVVPAVAGGNLLGFRPRVSTANLPTEVEVRAWDPVNAQAKAVRKPIDTTLVTLQGGDASKAAKQFAKTGAPARSAKPELGPAPSAQALVVHDRAVTVDKGSTQALEAAATALAGQAASGYAEAEAELLGDSRVVPGATLKVSGVPDVFAGSWPVSRARHVFDANDRGYRTQVTVSGRQDRSLLALMTTGVSANGAGTAGGGPPRVQGVVGAVVTDIDDPLGLGRVKVALPWLSPDYETGWAPVSQLGAGKRSGVLFLPEPEDQVLVAFEFGDLRRPYVLGSLVNKRTGSGGVLTPGGAQPGKSAVKSGRPASVIRRGIRTPSGNRLVFHDDGPPGGGRPTASQVLLATDGDKLAVTLDAVKGTLAISCAPGTTPGRLTIECDGTVEIKAGAKGTLTIDGGNALTLKGKTVQIEGTGPVAVKGKPIQLN